MSYFLRRRSGAFRVLKTLESLTKTKSRQKTQNKKNQVSPSEKAQLLYSLSIRGPFQRKEKLVAAKKAHQKKEQLL